MDDGDWVAAAFDMERLKRLGLDCWVSDYAGGRDDQTGEKAWGLVVLDNYEDGEVS